MQHEFCTLFDRNYLTRGLALYRSLERTCPSFRLWVFCMDDASEEALRSLSLPAVEIVALSRLEEYDSAFLGTKLDRTQVEYCWTATPVTCLYVLDADEGVREVTYLDADLLFFSDPQPLFDELDGDAVLIVPHRYAPEHRYKELTSGIYNVEWLTFRRDDDGLGALRWWHDRCIEWCYFRWEDGKLGDQKYLEQFPLLFERVHVLRHPGGGVAPWNVTNHTLAAGEGGVPLVDGRPAVFYHYHSLRPYRRGLATRAAVAARRVRPGPTPWSTQYPVSDDERRLFWDPYLRALEDAARELGGFAPLPPAYPAAELARSALRAARRSARRAAGAVAARAPGGSERYRDSWRSAAVAAAMTRLTETQLTQPETVPPYRAFLQVLEVVLEDPALPDPARFLDIGCGVGAYADLLERYAPDRFVYVGADYSDEILEAARRRAPGRQFVRRDLFEPGALDGYDVVLASALLDVLPAPARALDALLAADARHVVLHRQRIAARERVAVVGGYPGQLTYSTAITIRQLEDAAQRHRRRVAGSAEVEADIRSFVLQRV